jgi:hypothetical protein
MAKKNYPVPPRSACIICPFHDNESWQVVKASDEWRQVVEFDKAIRANGRQNISGELFLHRDLKPIDEVDFTTAKSAGQMSFLDECEGGCGI